jgi:GDSL-like Lipase/Acylhydrolase family
MRLFIALLCAAMPLICVAQADTNGWQVAPFQAYPFLKTKENVIHHAESLKPMLEKLQQLKAAKKKKNIVRVVHIGDSHLQADMITAVLRYGFQDYFGNAGRGLVFPYQLAKSNAPADIASASNVTWRYNRCAHPEIDIANGITGFGIHSNAADAYVNMRLKPGADSVPQYFNKLVFFLGNDSGCYALSSPGLNGLVRRNANSSDTPSLTINTDTLISEFTLSKCKPDKKPFDFYGVSLERGDTGGVIYHTIGCNGVQYSQFDNNDLFCEQLHAIKGDLYILSMGTNEAQNQHIKADSFLHYVDSMVRLIRSIAPKAAILITTPPVSFFQEKHPNAALEVVAKALVRYCDAHEIAYWDLYHVCEGYNGAVQWKKHNLMAHDFVHFNKDGYTLQGQLLLNALAHTYNTFNKAYPYKPKVVKTTVKSGK